ncbi:MAG: hypothetical protein HRT68_14040 [Flavobacteriaceae bacterium]|nr:hypothetical protein [Flavobacteriaceae bacterium]
MSKEINDIIVIDPAMVYPTEQETKQLLINDRLIARYRITRLNKKEAFNTLYFKIYNEGELIRNDLTEYNVKDMIALVENIKFHQIRTLDNYVSQNNCKHENTHFVGHLGEEFCDDCKQFTKRFKRMDSDSICI